jgi:hypothetical protein
MFRAAALNGALRIADVASILSLGVSTLSADVGLVVQRRREVEGALRSSWKEWLQSTILQWN